MTINDLINKQAEIVQALQSQVLEAIANNNPDLYSLNNELRSAIESLDVLRTPKEMDFAGRSIAADVLEQTKNNSLNEYLERKAKRLD